MNSVEHEIQTMVDRETEAWNRKDAEALVSICHPDMVWPWPPNQHANRPSRLRAGEPGRLAASSIPL
jgi:hypothetical protein